MVGTLRRDEGGTEYRPNSIREHPMGGENGKEGLAERPTSLDSALPCATEAAKRLEATPLPGPWLAQPEYSGARATYVTAKDGCFVADCGAGWVQDEANARLVAAAPEMFEALMEMLDEFGELEHADCDCAACKRVRLARAALRAATGEAK